jgi:hypothetical protein
MGWATRFALAAIAGLACGFGFCGAAAAHPAPDPAGAWEEAQSLRELPAGIQALLGVGLGGRDGIADRGEGFNIGDVIVDNTPQRRFALGIGNGTTTVVAVEQGGIGYSVQVLEFHQDGTMWEPARCTARPRVPRHGADLLDAFTAQAPGVVASCRMSGGHVSVEMTAPRGLVAPAPAPLPGTPTAAPRVRPRPGA